MSWRDERRYCERMRVSEGDTLGPRACGKTHAVCVRYGLELVTSTLIGACRQPRSAPEDANGDCCSASAALNLSPRRCQAVFNVDTTHNVDRLVAAHACLT